MAYRLYPRLPRPIAVALAETHMCETPESLEMRSSIEHPDAVFAPTGGSRVTTRQLEELRDCLMESARARGYPGPSSQAQRAQFDSECARILYQSMGLSPHEAAQDTVWQFVSCVLVPALVVWRWSRQEAEFSRDRFLGGVRNTFGRLWWRAEILREPDTETPWDLIERLGEDEMVQIMERSNMMGWAVLSRATAREFLSLVDSQRWHGAETRIPRSELLRELQKRLLRWAAIVAIEMMTPEQIRQRVRVELLEALQALQVEAGRSKQTKAA